jgi:RNA polymerase sigma-70 factor (ECF subfamily)
LLQGFFLVSLEKNYIHAANPAAGRFRTFLLTALTRYVSNQTVKKNALKRGGGVAHIRIDADDAEDMHTRIPSNSRTPEEVFERQWALGVLDRALKELEREYSQSGRGRLFEELRPHLATGEECDYDQTSARLGMTRNATYVAIHRLRERYRRSIKAIIAETVATPGEVDDEIRYLMNSLRSHS